MPNSNPLSIGIVGAGTAGLAAAIALARAGHDVTVFEKHAALEPLGAGVLIQPQGVAALDMLGVGSWRQRPRDRPAGYLPSQLDPGRHPL